MHLPAATEQAQGVASLIAPRRAFPAIWCALAWSSACEGPQSALQPAGIEAARIDALLGWMVAGSVVVLAVSIGIALYASWPGHAPRGEQSVRRLIWIAGAAVPTVVLTAVLIAGLSLLPDLLAAPTANAVRVHVTGEQWWWRVRYERDDGAAVDLANEMVLPVGRPVALTLEAKDVIHSFWIPPLGGKMDMIPGRTTQLVLRPTKTGTFRGVCAEYCGTSHALMAFPAVVVDDDTYARWLDAQSAPARAPVEPTAARGAALFLANGCGACHTVRGTDADGTIGPDLTHVGGRTTIAAGTLPSDPAAMARWIAHPDRVKPGVLMPSFAALPQEDIDAMSAYLAELR